MTENPHSHVTWQRVAVAALVVLSAVAGWSFEQGMERQNQTADAVQKLTVQVAQLTEQVREQNILLTSIPDTRHRLTVIEGKVGRLEQDMATLKRKHE